MIKTTKQIMQATKLKVATVHVTVEIEVLSHPETVPRLEEVQNEKFSEAKHNEADAVR